jgi:hypothetical protein
MRFNPLVGKNMGVTLNIEASNNSLKHVLEGEGIVQFRS